LAIGIAEGFQLPNCVLLPVKKTCLATVGRRNNASNRTEYVGTGSREHDGKTIEDKTRITATIHRRTFESNLKGMNRRVSQFIIVVPKLETVRKLFNRKTACS
jgi:hypothetical protein